ncbi:MAG: RNA polymerase sigma factor [Pseudomonadota bacterium]
MTAQAQLAEPPPASREDTLDEFLRSVQRRAFMLARYATRNDDDALDIVQDAMTAFVRHYRTKPAGQRAPLFFRSLNNRIIDFHRQKKRRSIWQWPWSRTEDMHSDGPDPMAVEASNRQPAAQAEHGEFGHALQQALQNLPERQRQVFLLRAWQGLSVAETALALDISSGSIKTHYFRALNTLREQLEQHHDKQ